MEMSRRAYPFIYLPAMILVFSIFFLHFGFVVLSLSCFLLGILLRTALKKDYMPVFSFLIPILPAGAVFAKSGFPNNYLILPLLVLAGIVIADIAMNRELIGTAREALPRHYAFYLVILTLSFFFLMLRWSNLTLSPLAFFRDTPVAPTGQRVSFGIIFPVVELALFSLSPLYYLLLQRQAHLRRVLVAFLSGQSLSIFYSFFQHWQKRTSPKIVISGLASDATAFGFLAALGVLLSWHLYFRHGRKKSGLVFGVISLFGIWNAATRIGLLAVVLVFFLFVFTAKKKVLAFALLAFLLAASLLLYVSVEQGPASDLLSRLQANGAEFARMLGRGGKDPGSLQNLVSNRDILLRYSLECLRHFPLAGVGAGNFIFWVMHANQGGFFHHLPANQYFFITASSGMLGLSIFAIFCFGLFPGKKWPEKIVLGMFLFLLVFNDYLWFSEVFLVFWLFCSLGEPGKGDDAAHKKSTGALYVIVLLAFILIHLLKFSDLHPKTWAKANSASYDYGLSYAEFEKGHQFQWTGNAAGVFIYLDAEGRNRNFRLVCGAPLSRFKSHKQIVEIYWRGRFFKRVVFRGNDEYPILIEDREHRQGFLEFRVQPAFSMKEMKLGRETRILGVQLFGADIPGLRLLSPNGDEQWLPGSIQDIRWQSQGNVPYVKIEISYDGGRSYATIADPVANSGLYRWPVKNGPSTNCLVRIGGGPGAATDVSDGPFAIASPPAVTGQSFAQAWQWTDEPIGNDGWHVGDFNGDGRADIMTYIEGKSGAQVLLSKGSRFVSAGNWTQAEHGADGWHVGDFNGDGRSDLLRYLTDPARSEVFLSTGAGFAGGDDWLAGANGADGWYVGDFDGDGRSDIMRYLPYPAKSEVFLSKGARFTSGGIWLTGSNGSDGWYVGDYNGDGRSDIMRVVPGKSGAEVFLSDGTQFIQATSWTGANPGAYGWYVGDFNGDKKSDIMRYAFWMSGADVSLAGETEFVHDGKWSESGIGDADWDIGDFNGDGRGDLLRYRIFKEGVSGGDVLLSAAAGIFPGTKASPARETRGNGRWLEDLPFFVEDMSLAQEKALTDAIKHRIAAGEEVSFLEIKREYEKLSGRKCRRVKILRLLKKFKLNQ